jgi:hypothetical protein
MSCQLRADASSSRARARRISIPDVSRFEGANPERSSSGWSQEIVARQFLAKHLRFTSEIHPTNEASEQFPWEQLSVARAVVVTPLGGARAKPLAGLDGVQEDPIFVSGLRCSYGSIHCDKHLW